MKNKTLPLVLGCLLALFFPAGLKAIDITTNSIAGWTVLPKYDVSGDTNIGNGQTSLDIVGDATYPSVFYRFTPSGDSIAVRIRVNNCDGPANAPQFRNFAYIGIDANNSGTIDFFIGAYDPTGTGRLGIYLADPAAENNAPGRTGIAPWPVATFQPIAGVNYSMLAAGSTFSSNADYFITFKFSVADIATAIAGLTAENITFSSSAPFTFVAGTSTQDNTLYGDINGIDNKNIPTPTPLWTSLFPRPMSTNGWSWSIVTFDMNGGDVNAVPQTIVVRTGYPITQFPTRNPIKRNGYLFLGWSTTANPIITPPTPPTVTNPFNLNTIINADRTVYATWEYTGIIENVQEHIVHFDPVGGTWSSAPTGYRDVLSDDGSIKNLPLPPTPPSVPNSIIGGNATLTFGGWVTDYKKYTGNGQITAAGYQNIILVSGTITLDQTPVDLRIVKYFLSSQWVVELDSLVKQPHSGQYEYTVYALWLAIPSNIQNRLLFYDNIANNNATPPVLAPPGALVYTGVTGNSSFPALTPEPISRQGFIFRGWDTNMNANPNLPPGQTGTTRFLDPLDPAKSVTAWQNTKFTATTTYFYAMWQAANYALLFMPNTIDYVLNPLVGVPSGTFGYVLCPPNASGLNYPNPPNYPPPPNFPNPPTLTGYEFVGWNTQPDGSGFFTDSLGNGATIKASNPVRYTLMTPSTDSVTLASDFNGTQNGKRVLLGGYTPLYALWQRTGAGINTTVKFDAMGGKFGEPAAYYDDTSDPAHEHHLLVVPAVDGYLDFVPTPQWPPDIQDENPLYVFAGWSFSSAGNRTVADPAVYSWISDPRLLVNGVTLYAVWIHVNTVIFHPRGGIWPADMPDYGGTSQSIKVPTDNDGYAAYVPGALDPAGILENHPLPPSSSYTFIEWNTDPDGAGTTYTRTSMKPNGALNVYAQWQGPPRNATEIFYDLNFVPAGMGQSERYSGGWINWGNPITPLPADPYRPGDWRFRGWYTEPTCTVHKWDFTNDLITSANGTYLVLYAKWLGPRHVIIINEHVTGKMK